MSKKVKPSEKEQEELKKKLAQEVEEQSILMEADKIKEEILQIDTEGNIELKNEIGNLLSGQIDDPEAKYQLYYHVISKLLQKHLPKGKKFAKIRDLIYEEKNAFLTRGHRKDEKGRRGADGRMSYISDIESFITILTEWITSQGTTFELYTKLLDLNVSKGYGKPKDSIL
jgi:hypothetical protein